MTTESPADQTPEQPKAPKPARTSKPRAKAARAPRAPRVEAPVQAATPAAPAPNVIQVSEAGLVGALTAAINAAKPAEKITVANRVARNPMNPTNEKRAWKKPFYQNFEKVEVDDVTPIEYELIPQLRTGLFVRNRRGIPLIEVVVVKRGTQSGIHMRYDNSKKDKSMELMTEAPTLEIMLRRCIAEYAQQQEVLAKRRAAGLSDVDEDE